MIFKIPHTLVCVCVCVFELISEVSYFTCRWFYLIQNTWTPMGSHACIDQFWLTCKDLYSSSTYGHQMRSRGTAPSDKWEGWIERESQGTPISLDDIYIYIYIFKKKKNKDRLIHDYKFTLQKNYNHELTGLCSFFLKKYCSVINYIELSTRKI